MKGQNVSQLTNAVIPSRKYPIGLCLPRSQSRRVFGSTCSFFAQSLGVNFCFRRAFFIEKPRRSDCDKMATIEGFVALEVLEIWIRDRGEWIGAQVLGMEFGVWVDFVAFPAA